MGLENLEKIFNPKRIAVIGASERARSVGAKILKNLVGVGYKGVVYPVNPFNPTVQGITAYPNISKIPWPVDLAIIATPAHVVPQLIDECGKAGVSGIIIVSAGFRETGLIGGVLEKQIVKYKNEYGMRIIGPNSFGVMRPSLNLNATFASRTAIPGNIAFISQSAALCASILDWALEAYIGFSAIVSTGSMLDVDFGDLIDYFGTDPKTRSIVLFIESIKDARKFLSAARGFARVKPIVVVKAGRFDESQAAIYSHTGALCVEDAVYDAAFRRAGMVRVETISDLLSCSEALAKQPRPKGSNLTIITNAGGPAIMATDSLIEKGGNLSQLDTETIQELRRNLPSYCSVINPIDILEEATQERFKKTIEIAFKDTKSDGFLIIYSPQGPTNPLEFAGIIIESAKQTKKPIITVLLGEGDCRTARRILQKKGILAFTTPDQAISTFMYMYSYTQNLELLYQTPQEVSLKLSKSTFVKNLFRKAVNEERSILHQYESLEVLKAYQIPTIRTQVAKNSDEAKSIASEMGYPVVMKALSPQVIHKSQVGGVILNVYSPGQVSIFFKELAKRIKNYNRKALFQGVIIQPMIQERSVELLVGAMKNLQFGPIIVFGRGGVDTEWFKDISMGFPPLNQILARRLMEKTKIYEHLTSNDSNSEITHIENILVRFSKLVTDFPEIKEIDINPIVFQKGKPLALDARIVINKQKTSQKVKSREHLTIAPYPKKYVADWKLKNDTRVLLRPIMPEDEGLFKELFNSFSEETMRFRFFQVIKNISHETLIRYCNLDYDRELAIIAETSTKEKRIVGVGRLIREPGGKCGEFAVVVGDEWQGLGLGDKLMDLIIQIGRDMNLEYIWGFVVSNNHKMLELCAKKGFTMEPLDEDTEKAVFTL